MLSRFTNLLQLTFLLLVALSSTAHSQDESTFRVMSFNIRLGVANDGDNRWDLRKDLVVQTIAEFNPDVVGTQETWDFQAKYLAETLDGYTYVGRSRQPDGKGEQCGILFRTKRFDKLIEGHFWLSETPDEPGSKSWDSSLPRMVTWLKLWDRINKRTLYVVNTHFDHRGSKARNQSAKQIRRFIQSLPEGSDVVVTGDFNAAEDSAPYKSLFAKQDDQESPVLDTFRIINPERTKNEGTFGGFTGAASNSRIDWIAATRGLKIMSASIDKRSFENRYPSDHYPVTSVLEFGR